LTPGESHSRRILMAGVTLVGIVFTLIEMVSYVLIFAHVAYHDNNIATTVLHPSVIQKRNHVAMS
jgi:hypothetical protein